MQNPFLNDLVVFIHRKTMNGEGRRQKRISGEDGHGLISFKSQAFWFIFPAIRPESTKFRRNAILPGANSRYDLVKPRAALMGLITAHERNGQ